MKQRTLRGTVVSGAGFAARGFGHMIRVIRERSGLSRLHADTVNVKLPHWYAIYPDITILAHEYGHHEHLYLERCRVFGRDALLVRTSQNQHGSQFVEVLAEERVRRNHRVKIGDSMSVTVWERGPKRPKEPGRAARRRVVP
jgi:CTP-dependent riboflavin kinase